MFRIHAAQRLYAHAHRCETDAAIIDTTADNRHFEFAGTRSCKNSAIYGSTVMTRSGRWVKHFASSIIVVPASQHDGIASVKPAMRQRVRSRVYKRAIAAQVVVGWAGSKRAAPRRHDTAGRHALLISDPSRRMKIGWRCVGASASCSTVTSVWFSKIRHNEKGSSDGVCHAFITGVCQLHCRFDQYGHALRFCFFPSGDIKCGAMIGGVR